jgi:hypothetical protein
MTALAVMVVMASAPFEQCKIERQVEGGVRLFVVFLRCDHRVKTRFLRARVRVAG